MLVSGNKTVLEPKMYIVVNKSLNLSKGKIAGQVGHGVASIVRKMERLPVNHSKRVIYNEWNLSQEAKIVCSADVNLMNKLYDLFAEERNKENLAVAIFDAGKTQCKENSFTVLAFKPLKDIPIELKKLKLL